MRFPRDSQGDPHPAAIVPLVLVIIFAFVVFGVPCIMYGLDHWFHYAGTWHWTGSLKPGPPLPLEKQ